MFVGVCAAAAQRAAIPARASAGRSARTSHAGSRERVQPAYTFFTRSPLDTDWRATHARRPSAGGQSQFRSAFWAESSFHLQWKSPFSILFVTLLRKTPSGLAEFIPSILQLRPVQEYRPCSGGAREKSGRVDRLDHVYGFPSRQSANAEPRANKSLVAKNGSAEDKLFLLVRFTKQVELRIDIFTCGNGSQSL